MTSSNPAYKRRRLDLAAPGAAAAAPQTPPALVAFPAGGVAASRPAPGSLAGTPLAGSVDAEFDMGYFVTITAGGQDFKGALLCMYAAKAMDNMLTIQTNKRDRHACL